MAVELVAGRLHMVIVGPHVHVLTPSVDWNRDYFVLPLQYSIPCTLRQVFFVFKSIFFFEL